MEAVLFERLDTARAAPVGNPCTSIEPLQCLADFKQGNTNVARGRELARNRRQRLQAPTWFDYIHTCTSMCPASREEARQKDGSVTSSIEDYLINKNRSRFYIHFLLRNR